MMHSQALLNQMAVMGPATLSLPELFMLLLNLDVEDSTELSDRLHPYDLPRLQQASVHELQASGFEQMQAERLVLVCELARRFAYATLEARPSLSSDNAAARALMPLIAHLPFEALWVLTLDSKYQLMQASEVYRGTIHEIPTRIAEILRPAIVCNSIAIIVAHNHPSQGTPVASTEDRERTMELVEAADLFGIELVDHLIVSDAGWVSLKKELQW